MRQNDPSWSRCLQQVRAHTSHWNVEVDVLVWPVLESSPVLSETNTALLENVLTRRRITL